MNVPLSSNVCSFQSCICHSCSSITTSVQYIPTSTIPSIIPFYSLDSRFCLLMTSSSLSSLSFVHYITTSVRQLRTTFVHLFTTTLACSSVHCYIHSIPSPATPPVRRFHRCSWCATHSVCRFTHLFALCQSHSL